MYQTNNLLARWLAGVALSSAMMPALAADNAPLPRLETRGAATQLLVDGKPWIALGGEVHNSSASSKAYMGPLFAKLRDQHVNTAISPVYWELAEPQEGRFDFSLVDEQIRLARVHGMRLVLLWFGTQKNARSQYAPAWVRADLQRFPRAGIKASNHRYASRIAPISLFGGAIAAADAKAFARLADHLAATDPQRTVIALQVQNEPGLLADSRDRSPAAEKAWNGPVPPALMSYIEKNKGSLAPSLEALWRERGYQRSGTWSTVFGDDWQAEELFMAWKVASFVDQVAAAGKARLALPMFANAWLGPTRPEERAGDYPSGSPVPRVFDVWRAAAPHLDWLSPDIYVDDFQGWAASYRRPGNPLFIPEARFIVGNLFVALGQHQANGYAPFGIEDALPGNQIAEAYGLLRPMLPLLAQAQADGTVRGWALAPGESRQADLGDYTVTVRGHRDAMRKRMLDMGVAAPAEAPSRQEQNRGWGVPELTDVRPAGLILQLGPDEFLAIGKDLQFEFAVRGREGQQVEVAQLQEGHYADGKWVPGRVLNGDEGFDFLPPDRLGMTKITLLRPR